MTPFFPPDPARPPGILRRWAAPLPQAWVRAVVEAATRPGDLVVDPFCQGDAVAREALRLGRSVAAVDFNPVQTLAARAAITPPAAQTLARATRRLAETVKVDRPLSDVVQSLYLTRCPHCRAETPAEVFTWDGTAGVPTRKTLTCAACGWRGAAPADADDVARANELEPLGLSHYYLVQEATGQDEARRPLAERLVNLYPPRAQRALADLLRHKDPRDQTPDEGEALRMVLLGCLDWCTSLNAAAWDTAPPRRLEPPRRYVEVNVWHAFETLTAWLRDTPAPPDAEWVAAPDQIPVDAGLPFAHVGRATTRALAEALAGRVQLSIGAPPRMSGLFWTLSWLWASWLWSENAARPLRALAERGAPDWDWYAAAVASSLGSLRGALTPTGRVALRWSADRDALGAVLLGSTRTGFGLADHILRQPRPGARWLEAQVVLTPGARPRRLTVEDFGRVSQALGTAAGQAALAALRAQGEPLGHDALGPLGLAALAEGDSLGQAVGLFDEPALGLEFAQAKVGDGIHALLAEGALVRLEEGRLWPTDAADMAAPLVERVERVVIEGLAQAAVPTAPEDDDDGGTLPLASVYAALPGHLAPDTEIVSLALDAHGRSVAPGVWAADGDGAALRQAVGDLVLLGEALGYSVQFPLPWAIDAGAALAPVEVVWYAGGKPTTRFVLQLSALLAPHAAPPALAVPHLLVIPERCAALLRVKLRRIPALAERLTALGWEYLVAERLHRWLTMPTVDPETWRDAVGLEERGPHEGQLRLFTDNG